MMIILCDIYFTHSLECKGLSYRQGASTGLFHVDLHFNFSTIELSLALRPILVSSSNLLQSSVGVLQLLRQRDFLKIYSSCFGRNQKCPKESRSLENFSASPFFSGRVGGSTACFGEPRLQRRTRWFVQRRQRSASPGLSSASRGHRVGVPLRWR